MVSPFSSDPLHHFNVSQHTGPPLPHLAIPVQVVFAGEKVELDHTEHLVAVLDKHTKPDGKETQRKNETSLTC